jgi:cystathionine beta-lyase/cystathionine gamma-synthase
LHEKMNWNDGTKLIHAGKGTGESPRPKVMPIYQTSVFTFADLDDCEYYYRNAPEGRYLYTRNDNPNYTSVARIMASLEAGEDAVVTASGMAAIMAAIVSQIKTGDHILASTHLYGGTYMFLTQELKRFGVETTFVDFAKRDETIAAFRPNTRLLVAETIANPLLQVLDVAAIAQLAHERGAKLIVDNTFATPCVIKPLQHGADIVIHSTTKYIGGHSDVTGGVVIGSKADMNLARRVMVNYGACASPFDSWLVQRGVATLDVRMDRIFKNALTIAQRLKEVKCVKRVVYPGLPDHPDHELAKRLMQGKYGGIVSFEIAGNRDQVNHWIRSLNWIVFAPSLAGVATTLSHPETTSHRGLTKQEREELSITTGLIRLSVGIEAVDDIWEDLNRAFSILMGS